MSNSPQCDECQAILEELRAAFAETSGIPKTQGDESRDSLIAFLEILGQKEAYTDRLDELLNKFPFRPQHPASLGANPEPPHPKTLAAFRRLLAHRAKTGHDPLFLK